MDLCTEHYGNTLPRIFLNENSGLLFFLQLHQKPISHRGNSYLSRKDFLGGTNNTIFKDSWFLLNERIINTSISFSWNLLEFLSFLAWFVTEFSFSISCLVVLIFSLHASYISKKIYISLSISCTETIL